ncbi:phosphotransferase [Gymnodinialimonas sp. 2305UL16-5]|uniref:phosphotransferase n=1 Tax=Gymnodinialimonas mytili TaxID=3126503 RepID=UPI0030AD67A9
MTYPADRYAEVRLRPSWADGAICFDDIQTVLVPLRLERRLRGGRVLAHSEKRGALLDALGLTGCALRILRYKPGRRIVLRADGPDGPRAAVKLHADRDAFEAAADGAAHSAAMGGAPLLGLSKAHGAVAVGWLTGAVLSPRDGPSGFAHAGRALAAAHATPATTMLADWTPQDPMEFAASLGELLPDLAATATRLAADLLPPLPDNRAAPVHGDFSPDQVAITRSQARLVDWDRAAWGDPARDLGSFLAALDLAQIRGTPTEAASEALRAGYDAAGAAAGVDDDAIAAHRVHALFALAQDGFRARRPGWATEAQHVLDKTRRLLWASPRHIIPGLPTALSERIMRPRIEAASGQAVPELSAELVRIKPGRRALVRYSGRGRALLGKMSAKGPDQSAPRIQARLRAAGLDGRKGVGVPEVVGTLSDPGIWIQEEVPGEPLGALLHDSDAASAVKRTGRALATLHATAPQTERSWSLQDELDVVRRAVDGGPYADLLDSAKRALAALPATEPQGLHRDFYFDQVIVDACAIWLVDLDLYAIGDPAIDIGNFCAHLIELGLRNTGDPMQFDPLRHAFLDGYETVQTPPERERIETLTWVSLTRHVRIATRFEDRRHTIPAIATLCRAQLGAQPPSARAAM